MQVGSLTKLTALRLNGNALSGGIPAELGSLAKLRTLALSGNALTGCVPNALWLVGTKDLAHLRLSSCTAPVSFDFDTPAGEGTYRFDHYPLVINIPPNGRISLFTFVNNDAESGGISLWYYLQDMETGSLICYNPVSGIECGRSIKAGSVGQSGGSSQGSADLLFDQMTNSARSEPIW